VICIPPHELVWVEYDGTLETLPNPFKHILFYHPCYSTPPYRIGFNKDSDFVRKPVLKMNNGEFTFMRIGTLWAYLYK
jgi:hypothetical protein